MSIVIKQRCLGFSIKGNYTCPQRFFLSAEIALYALLNCFNRLANTEIEAQVLPFVSDQANWITEPDR